MKLRIRYKDSFQSPVSAAFIRSAEPSVWLKEIDKWNIAMDELECYVLPSSIQSVDASGLFVIFKDHSKAKDLSLQDPYTCIEKRLFIPCTAEIIPQVNRDELNKVLLWDKQIFHPVIGLVGVEPKDQLKLIDLLSIDGLLESDWSYANPGIPSKPGFNEISIIKQTAEELINLIKDEIGQKPIDEISKKDRSRSFLQKVYDEIRYLAFKGASGVLKVVGGESADNNNADHESVFQKFSNWISRNLEELEKKRQDEIKRLLNLFDENTNEALQYAIPLDSPYFNRGETHSSTYRLTKKPLQFNLGNLGGGGRVDLWDIGHYYNDLRLKYLAAAKKEIEKKDFKKAAYIYAHLLGDYTSAANTLEQGGMFREAASLYKDHLKNISSAAECLERGGLFLESIELNKTLMRDEKVGDLYRKINQNENAEIFYEKHIGTKLTLNDHLDAARVVNEKLYLNERAQQILLQGWDHSYQHESCLKKYFDIIPDRQPADISARIKNVYTSTTPRHKRMSLLNVLGHVNKLNKDVTVKEITQEIMYEIVHEETKSGNIQSVHSLKLFLPDDRLIGSDANRFISNRRQLPSRSAPTDSFHLDTSIKWIGATWHRNQFLVIGLKNSYLHMARGNWYGNFEYYTWTNPIKRNARYVFVSSPYHSHNVIIHSSDVLPVTRKNLSKNKYFADGLIVYCPVWLHRLSPMFVIKDDATICRLDTENNLTLHYYSPIGDLKKSINCTIEGKDQARGYSQPNAGLIFHDGFYYTFWGKIFVTITEEGKVREFEFNTLIRFFSSSTIFAEFRIIISTNKGCLLYKPSGGALNMQGGFFAEQLIPTLIVFVQADRFVICEKTKAYLFEIRDETPLLLNEYNSHSPIIAVLPTSTRNQFALVEEGGKIIMCKIPI